MIKSAFARLFYKIMNKVSDAELVDGARDYRLMTRKMTDAVLMLSERDRFSKGIFGWVGFKIKWLEYKNVERVAGNTKWNFRKLTKYAVGGIEDFSTAPLRFNNVVSLLLFLAAVGFAAFDIVWACLGKFAGVGMLTLFIIIPVTLFLLSLLFFGMVLLGEYIKKIFKEVKARPVYLVRETEKDAVLSQTAQSEKNEKSENADAFAEVAATRNEP